MKLASRTIFITEVPHSTGWAIYQYMRTKHNERLFSLWNAWIPRMFVFSCCAEARDFVTTRYDPKLIDFEWREVDNADMKTIMNQEKTIVVEPSIVTATSQPTKCDHVKGQTLIYGRSICNKCGEYLE